MRPAVLLAPLAALALLGCDQIPWMVGEGAEAAPPRLVVVEPVTVGEAVERVDLPGDIHGRQEVRVFAQVAETIRVLHVQEGDTVAAGDPIVTLDASLQTTGLAQAGAALTAAEVSRDQLRADVARAERLVQQGATARSQLTSLQAQLASAEAQVEQLSAARRSARQQRDRTVVRAPVGGVVALLSAHQGDMAVPSVPLCLVVQTDPVDVHLRVTEQDYVRLQEGMEVEVGLLAVPGFQREGRLRRLSPVLDRATRTASAEVEVANADGALRPGMVAEVSVVLSRRDDVILVPGRAVLVGATTDTDRRASVYAVREGAAHRTSVRLGRRYGDRVEIVQGLAGGETVVVQGQHLLRDGAEVRTESVPLTEGSVARVESP